MAEAVGHVESLDIVAAVDHYWKAGKLDLRPILEPVSTSLSAALHRTRDQDHGLDKALDRELIEACGAAISEGRPIALDRPIRNVHRAVGTMLGSEITRRHGGAGLPDGTISLTFRGSAGQSFGAFVPRGITMKLFGDANDYLGKGLSGGIIVGPATGGLAVSGRGPDHRRQRRALRGDLGHGVHPRTGRRTILRPQFRRRRCRRRGR